ncbi:hypothetical protein [Streptomyces sp. Wb2n-11]|uniref:hypothetical protein n=1 Tax=Streptomyces sp. Wb2n-11 TaxID=1030533 RepID=UPI000B04560E|nr:hypothetical protein [Streptomyces sp. Wb2n-11]
MKTVKTVVSKAIAVSRTPADAVAADGREATGAGFGARADLRFRVREFHETPPESGQGTARSRK